MTNAVWTSQLLLQLKSELPDEVTTKSAGKAISYLHISLANQSISAESCGRLFVFTTGAAQRFGSNSEILS